MDKNIIDFIENNKIEFDKFFGIQLALPKIELVADRKAFDGYWNRKTEDWEVGWAKEDTIFILDLENYTKESSHKDTAHFWQVLKHEHAHYYFRKTTGINYPKWLNEGLACYLAGQVKSQPTSEEALKVFDYFAKNDAQIYKLGYFWVKFLIEKFGAEKLRALIKTLGADITEEQFGHNFYNIYNFSYSTKDFKDISRL